MWTVVIPIKALPAAKSRLAPASADPAAHRRLVEAIRADTIAAARASVSVARVLIVSDRAAAEEPGRDRIADLTIVQTGAGLNAAVREGAAHAAARWPGDGIAALVGDLPALRPPELTDALREAAANSVSFVPDVDGTGTTLLAAAPGYRLRPAFGAGSAARHATFATAVFGAGGLRRDVDTAADLDAAALVGVGPATTAVLATVARCPSFNL